MVEIIAIKVNGENRVIQRTATLAVLVNTLGFDTRKVAIERNLEMVSRADYAATFLAAGDSVEIVNFIRGI
jgi:thiamine biosynthesis protein ThiS